MLRIALLRTLAMVAFFAATWLMPLSVYAAILPVCDGDAVSAFGPVMHSSRQTDSIESDDCRAGSSPSDEIDSQVAAMCDAQAATVLAPGRIHPMSDGRIDAVVTCDGLHHGPLASAPGPDHSPEGLSWVTIDQAILTEQLWVRPRLFVDLPPVFVVIGAPLPGFDPEVYHPPRA